MIMMMTLMFVVADVCSQKNVSDIEPGESSSRGSSNVEYLQNGNIIKPRQSLMSVSADVVNQPRAEDLSRPSKQPGPELEVQCQQWWQSVLNSQQARAASEGDKNSSYADNVNTETRRPGPCLIDGEVSGSVQSPYWMVENCGKDNSSQSSATQHSRLSTVNSVRPSSVSRVNSFHAADDIDSWLSASVVRPAEKRIVAENSPSAPTSDASLSGNTAAHLTKTAQSCDCRGFGSEAVQRVVRSTSTGVPSSAAQSGTLSVPRESRNTFVASNNVPMLAPPAANSGPKSLPQDDSQGAKSFPTPRSLGSLGVTSSAVFAKTPVLPAGMPCHLLAGVWPTPARALGEPSPVATVMPQVQMAGRTLMQRPFQDQSGSTRTVASAENTSAPATPQIRKRKRKRRAAFGTRRRSKKSHQTVAPQPDVPNTTLTKQVPAVISSSRPLANTPTAGLHSATSSSLVRSEVPVSIVPVTDKPAVGASVRSQSDEMKRALKPIENLQRGHVLASTRSDTSKPSDTQRSIALSPWLGKKAINSGHAPHTTTYTKRRQSSADLQKVPSASPRSDIFDFCADDDDVEPVTERPPLRYYRSTPSQSTRWPALQKLPTAGCAAGLKHGTFSDLFVTESKLR